MGPPSGHIFWIFGLSGAGKSTAAVLLADALRQRQIPVLQLDGDVFRQGLSSDLGFSDDDRTKNIHRAAEVAKLAANSGIHVVASFITPLETHRRLVRDIVGAARLSLIFAAAPLEICRQRDCKGLYSKAQSGQIRQLTGIDSLFERPETADFTLLTSTLSPAASGLALSEFAQNRLGRLK